MKDKETIENNEEKLTALGQNEKSGLKTLKHFILKPFLCGSITFSTFLLATIAIDFIINLSKNKFEIKIETMTLFIAFLGFVLGFAYRLYNKKED